MMRSLLAGLRARRLRRKQAEQSLRDSERQYRFLFESNPHAMWIYDLETLSFLAVNGAACRQYGYAQEEFLSMAITDIRPDEDVPELLGNVAKGVPGPEVSGTWRHRKKDGTLIDVEIVSHPLTFADRRARLVLAHDVTERKRAEEEIKALNERLERRVIERTEALEAARDELETQNTELEAQAVELEDQQARIASANDELEAQQAELERALAELSGEKELVDAFFDYGERLSVEIDLEPLAATILSGLADFAHAEIGTLYAAADDTPERFSLLAARAVDVGRLPSELAPGEGLPGRALAERRMVVAAHGETGLRLPAFGEEVALCHQLDVPLVHGERALGVVTLGRTVDRPFSTEEREAVEHLAGQAAVALGHALAFRRTSDLVGINSAVLDTTPDGIRFTDSDGRPVLTNARYREIMGSVGLADGGTPEERLKAAQERMDDPSDLTALVGGGAEDPEYEGEQRLELKDGRAFRLYTAPVRNGDGAPIGRLSLIREMTAEHQAERMKSELVATVSHELRTPLTGVMGFAELLLRHDIDDDRRRTYLETIYAEARRLTTLINDFLDIQRIESGGFTLALEQFDLSRILRQEVDLSSAQSASHALALDLPDEPLLVLGDPERVRQVVANLVGNAVKYAPAGGRVTVSSSTDGGFVRVSVADEGVGIPESQQHMVFQKFFRADTSDTRAIGGTGLGLALAREIVEAHGGRIGFASVEGKGSTFWFELPTPSNGDGRARRVLVVEDDAEAAELLVAWLEEDGYAIEVVASGEEALRRISDRPPDAICLDVRLAGRLDGWEVLARLKATPGTAGIPVVVCTGGNGRDRAASLGAADFLAKPIEGDVLLAAVRRVLPEGMGTVLVVDDEASVRRLVAEALTPEGLTVAEAADGSEALAFVERGLPDAMILDLVMPGVDGFAVLEALQRDPAGRRLPVIVLTGRTLDAAERALLRSRAVSLLEKSVYSASELRRLVRLALGRPGA